MAGFLWWVRQFTLIVAACFFILFGIVVLVSAYHLKDPFSFVMAFWASNLIILISAALLAGFIYRIVKSEKPSVRDPKQ